jgi:hypothetical protein
MERLVRMFHNKPFDDVIMHDVAPPLKAVTNVEMSVNTQPVATNDDVFRNTLADDMRMTMAFLICYVM